MSNRIVVAQPSDRSCNHCVRWRKVPVKLPSMTQHSAVPAAQLTVSKNWRPCGTVQTASLRSALSSSLSITTSLWDITGCVTSSGCGLRRPWNGPSSKHLSSRSTLTSLDKLMKPTATPATCYQPTVHTHTHTHTASTDSHRRLMWVIIIIITQILL